jgi:hypothetical protein
MSARVQEPAIVMLAVDFDQQSADLAQQPRRDRLVVDEGAAAAVRLDDSADRQRLAGLARQAVLLEQGERGMTRRQLEGDADRRLALAAAHEAAVGAGAERQAQGVEEDRFSGAGFAGQDAEAGAEFQVERFDQHHVADRQAGQHDGPIRPSPRRKPGSRLACNAIQS